MKCYTARPTWPENAMPTADQWRDWFLACDSEAQHAIAERVLESGDLAYRCILENHKALGSEVEHLRRRSWRLHCAWTNARRYRWAARKVFAGWTPEDPS